MANEWTLYIDEHGNGIKLEPTDCQPLHMFEISEGLNSPFFNNNNLIKNHAVDVDMFNDPYTNSSWHIDEELMKLINNGMEVSNFEEPYNYNSWYINKNGDFSLLNTGLAPANFQTPYNWAAWYLDDSPDIGFDINAGPWEEILGAFANAKNLTNLTIPDQVTKIGENAFRRSGLETVSIKSSTEYKENDTYDKTFSDDVEIEIRND